ncbi:MAG: hypothetical protein H7287_10495 [Thermoleophilia bacterium]|nr:hypothetical protein [Thermoleophilia bacterium]
MNNFSDILDLLRSMGLILAAVFYVAIVFWTYKDMRKRNDDPILIATATAVSMLPIVGVLVYLLLRPSEYLADVRERELEIRVMERELGRHERCPYCKSHIEAGYLSCPVCTTKLRQSCTGCDKPLDPRWVLCPFCETEVPGRGGPATPPTSGARSVSPRSAAPRSERSGKVEREPARDRAPRAPRDSSRTTERPSSKSSKPAARDLKSADAKDDVTSGISTEPFGKD